MDVPIRVRINRGVRPYGGRVFPAVLEERTDGTRVVLVDVSRSTRAGFSFVQRDTRIYRLDEVVILDKEKP